ncbi:hypothetical protein [Aurantimonas coralicida]|uniref:hypothetical protein n=1 Tax=Aurantimonas coralicida TaxID=182270 RepID=UPI001E49E568|nr:hypothetical protein [Aurantimonas coralicida]MCD1645239.1 hypothetical protein [Aurantimonas coralicida]
MAKSRIGLALAPPSTDAPHDLYLDGDGNLVMVTDARAVGQHVRQRLMTYEKEWFLDTTAGVPWLDEIMGKRENLALAEGLMKAEILDTDGVTGISDFSPRYLRSHRELNVPRAIVSTEYEDDVSL